MAKVVKANLKMRVPGGRASAGPPIGSIMGQHGVNLMEFVTAFNEASKDYMGKDVIVHVKLFEDRTYTMSVLGQPVDDMIREAAGIQKGSGKPHAEKVGKISKDKIREIAEKKMHVLNANDIEAAMKVVAGSARSMGVEVVD